jgi:non-ribosomal peptide synthetase component F
MSDMAPQVLAFCAANDVTVSNILHAAWAMILRAYTGLEDVCFGYITMGRDIPLQGVEGIVGPFINILTARLAVHAGVTVGALIKESKRAYWQALAHQGTSLAQVQHELGLAGQPLFNTGVSLQTHLAGDGESQEEPPELSFRSIGGHDPTEVSEEELSRF